MKPRSSLALRAKLLISAAVVLHFLCVLVEPFQFFTRSPRGESEAARSARRVLAPYTEMAYLNHGYFFFAPEPGPSHLLACDLTYANGDQAELRFPDKQAQWPRLLYHRHFMLAEFLHQLHQPPADPALAQVDPAAFKQWQSSRNVFEQVRESMKTHVAARYDAASVSIRRLVHTLPSSSDVLQRGMPLNDPALYEELLDEPANSAQPFPVDPQGTPPLLSPLGPILSPGPVGGEEIAQ